MDNRGSAKDANTAATGPNAASEDQGAGPEKASKPDAPAGWGPRDLLIPYILLAVSLQRAHGYLIEEYLKSQGFFALEMSTLYRTLRQLEKDGLLMSTWESSAAGPARRVYSLTDVGQSWLDSWSSALNTYRSMIDRFFDLYTPGQQSWQNASKPPRDSEQSGQSD